IAAHPGWTLLTVLNVRAISSFKVERGRDHLFLIIARFGQRNPRRFADERRAARSLFPVRRLAHRVGHAMKDLRVRPDRLLSPSGQPLPGDGFDFVRTARWVEKYLGAGHRRYAVKFRMPPVPADDQRADNPINLEERKFIAPTTIPLFISPGHVDFGVFVDDLSRRVDHVRYVEKPVGGLFQRAGDHPDAVFGRRLARHIERVLNLRGVEFNRVWEVITGEVGFGEERDSASLPRRHFNVMYRSLQVVFDRPGPMRLNARDLKDFGGLSCHQSFSSINQPRSNKGNEERT